MRFATKLTWFFLLFCAIAHAEVFVVKEISFSGLHRISLQTALSYLPVKEGDKIDSAKTKDIIRSLYKTNFFSDVDLSRDKNRLLIIVTERSVIETINISGNKDITKKQIVDLLKQNGIAEGQAYNAARLSAIEQQLLQQYRNAGHYDTVVKTNISEDSNHRISLNIVITETPVAKIRGIKISGNKAFPEKTLLKQLSLSTPSLFSFFTHDDQYSSEKLEADLETLRAYYLDRGYLAFKVDAYNATITPDKKSIYIAINISEGDIYKYSGFKLSGKFPGKKEDILALINLPVGKKFSRQDILDINSKINHYLGNLGYGSPKTKAIPEVDEQGKKVFINYEVDAGKRIYVRRIHFVGNNKTNEVVLRCEMRQQEGAIFSLENMNESRRRLANLGYLQGIDAKIEPVPGYPDQVDVTVNVKETNSASANFQVGYSDTDGFLYGISVNERNFLGTGKVVALSLNNSQEYKNYAFTYANPYFTPNAVSMSVTGYMQRHTPQKIDLSPYTTDIYGLSTTYGIPIAEYNRLNFGFGVEHIDLSAPETTSDEVKKFIREYGNSFNQLRLPVSWIYSNTDRALFPTSGLAQAFTFEFGLPLDNYGLEFYKLDYNFAWYHPLIKDFVFKVRGEFGYGNGYGKSCDLPFFKNFYAGGIESVHGFEPSSLGPIDSKGNPFGGNVLTTGEASIIIPNPMGDGLRTSAFVDIGNVYKNEFVFDDLRISAGVQAEWRSPLGILVFSFAKPLKSKDKDRTQAFQFSMGTSF